MEKSKHAMDLVEMEEEMEDLQTLLFLQEAFDKEEEQEKKRKLETGYS